ncbi:hypothetical protein J4N42_09450 [Vibrio sp. SCSIO 43135]|uniref:hypothetical protein n=1 Tax=Vibrio sp. SCSIO 43135 TaxID=2819096 RepID=UPI002075A1A0|nr:hypothetical protein [Vibrio sp. SCSIO 43135]USD40294.1 hypothetical protein J4N42_09450 [Vibrio sp. SCSIO 43135]
MDKKLASNISVSLLLLRVSIFVVFLMWGLDKIIVPEHAVKVMQGFYGLSLSTGAMMGLGVLQMLFLGAFVAGLWKKWTYGAILGLHAVSTLSSFGKYMDPFNNLLFFAAWPMLAACFALYVLRDYDTFTLGSKNKLVPVSSAR